MDLLTVMLIEQNVVLAAGAIGGFFLWRKLKTVAQLPNQFAEVLKGFGQSFGQSMKMSNLGKLSGDSRGAGAVMGQLLEQGYADNPIMSTLMGIPELRGTFKKYPFLAPLASGLIEKYGPAIFGALSGNAQAGQPGFNPGMANAGIPSNQGADSFRKGIQAWIPP